MLRASSLGRSLACPYSETIPHEERESSDAAEWGTALHRFIELQGAEQPPERIGKMVWSKKEAGVGALSRLYRFGDPKPLREAHFTYDVKHRGVSRYVGNNWAEYRASLPSYCITGTTDYIEDCGDYWLVDDFKTGKRCPEILNNTQLLFHALCVSDLFKVKVVCSITHYPYYPLAGEPVRHFWEPSREDLENFRASLEELVTELETPWATVPQVGEQCYFCPARANCAEYKKDEGGNA